MTRDKFELIIANPPYGSHGNLAKKIINTLQPFGKQFSIVSIPQGFKDLVQNVSKVSGVAVGAFDNMFIRTMICKLENYPINLYESLEVLRCHINIKVFKYYQALKNYNLKHKCNFEYLGSIKGKNNKERFEGKDCSLIFTIAEFSCAPSHKISSPIHLKGEDARINLLNEDIKFDTRGNLQGLLFKDLKQKKGFSDFWYGFNCREHGWESIKDQKGSLIDFIMDCVYITGGCYGDWFPNLDWNRCWSDKEILKELGLSENFLEEE